MNFPQGWWIEQKVSQMISEKAEKHEVNALRCNVDSLECANRQIRAEIDELRAWIERLQDCEISRLKDELMALQEVDVHPLVRENAQLGVGA